MIIVCKVSVCVFHDTSFTRLPQTRRNSRDDHRCHHHHHHHHYHVLGFFRCKMCVTKHTGRRASSSRTRQFSDTLQTKLELSQRTDGRTESLPLLCSPPAAITRHSFHQLSPTNLQRNSFGRQPQLVLDVNVRWNTEMSAAECRVALEQ